MILNLSSVIYQKKYTFSAMVVVEVLVFSILALQISALANLSTIIRFEIRPILLLVLMAFLLLILHTMRFFLARRVLRFLYSGECWSQAYLQRGARPAAFVAKGIQSISDFVTSIPFLIAALPGSFIFVIILNSSIQFLYATGLVLVFPLVINFLLSKWRKSTAAHIVTASQCRSSALNAYYSGEDIGEVITSLNHEITCRSSETYSEEFRNIAPSVGLFLAFGVIYEFIDMSGELAIQVLLTALLFAKRIEQVLEGSVQLFAIKRFDISFRARS